MRNTFPLTLVIGLLLAACGGVGVTTSTAMAVPSPTRVTTVTPPSLIQAIHLETQTGTAYTLAWSPDGETLAVASGGEITLLSADLKETLTVWKPEGGVLGVIWSPSMTQFATLNGFRNPTITIWDLDPANAALTPVQKIQTDADQYRAAWSPNGKSLATLANDRRSIIQIWDTGTGELLNKFELPYTNPRRALRWSADSSTVYDPGESGEQMVVFALNVLMEVCTKWENSVLRRLRCLPFRPMQVESRLQIRAVWYRFMMRPQAMY